LFVNMPSPKAEHIGSFLRPQAVLDARKSNQEGKLSDAELRKVEDQYVKDVVNEQLKNGLKSISDGEYRREYFHYDFLKHLGGVDLRKEELAFHDSQNKPVQLKLYVTGKVTHEKNIEVENYKYLQGLLDQAGEAAKGATIKMTIPSPTMVHFRGGRSVISMEAYPNLDDFFVDLAQAYREEIAALVAAGCKYIQFDDTNLAYLCDLNMRKEAAGRGEDLNTLPRQYTALINSALKDVPSDVTTAIHLCRGNFKSTHFAEGGYEPIAEVLFNELNVNTFLLEFDDSRSGSFEPLRFLPKGKKTVILGIVSSKLAQLEDEEKMIARVKEASQYAPLEQLGVSCQCGFSSTHHGNNLTFDEQWAKVRLVVSIAKKVWGAA